MSKTVAVSACLLGEKCRYDASDNLNETLLQALKGYSVIPFCPEDDAFGTPRPTMDLIATKEGDRAISNENGKDLSLPVMQYAIDFFDRHIYVDLFIGKDRSPSCGVCSAKLYDEKKHLLSSKATGLMAQEALRRGIECVDVQTYITSMASFIKRNDVLGLNPIMKEKY